MFSNVLCAPEKSQKQGSLLCDREWAQPRLPEKVASFQIPQILYLTLTVGTRVLQDI